MQTTAYSMLFYSTAILVRNRVIIIYKAACVLGLCQTRRLSGHGHHSQD